MTYSNFILFIFSGFAGLAILITLAFLKIFLKMESNNNFVTGLLSRIDTATNEIAADFKAYKDAAESGSISDEVKANAEASIAALEALGKDNDIPAAPSEAEA